MHTRSSSTPLRHDYINTLSEGLNGATKKNEITEQIIPLKKFISQPAVACRDAKEYIT